MKLSDEEVVERIRNVLAEWADEDPIAEPTPMALHAVTPMSLTEVAAESPNGPRTSTWLIAAVCIALVIGLAVVAMLRSDPPASVVNVGPTPSTTVEIRIGRSFGVRGLEVTEDAVWVTSHWDEELYRVDPLTDQVVETFSIPSHIEGVREVGDSLWLSRYEPNELIRVDPETGRLTDRLAFDSQPNVASDGTRLWVIAERAGEGVVVEVDPETGAEIREVPLDAPPGFAAFDDGSLWVANVGAHTVSRIDLTAGRVSDVIEVAGEPRDVVAAAGSIWVGVNQAGTERVGSVVRIDPTSATVTATTATGRWTHSLAAGDGAIWATNFDDGTVSIIDTTSAKIVATSPIGNRPGAVAIGDGSVWITPHRRNVLLRIDPSVPLEAAAVPDLEQTIDVGTGTVYLRCSGSGTPTLVLVGNQAEGVAKAVVEARLSRSTRVCAYEPVGIADPDQLGRGGPAATVADDLGEALDIVGERGPFMLVGESLDGLDAQMFAATHRQEVVGLVLINGMSPAYIERLRSVLPAEALERFDQARQGSGELQYLDESSAQVAATGDLGDLPLIVLSDQSSGAWITVATSDPMLTTTESDAISQLQLDTRREQAGLSTTGQLIIAQGGRITPADVVDATTSLLP